MRTQEPFMHEARATPRGAGPLSRTAFARRPTGRCARAPRVPR